MPPPLPPVPHTTPGKHDQLMVFGQRCCHVCNDLPAAVFGQQGERAVEHVANVVGKSGVDDVAEALLAEVAVLAVKVDNEGGVRTPPCKMPPSWVQGWTWGTIGASDNVGMEVGKFSARLPRLNPWTPAH
eukprot:365756-Chlamydomonas_euryale.AAC.22